jgi:DNA-binding NarL/FixJ family response regulator
MILSKKPVAVNEFTFCGGIKPKINPIDYRRAPVRTALLTPNRVFAIGLTNAFENKDMVDFIKVSTSALNAITHWQQQPRCDFPELIILDTYQYQISCTEAIQRFKALNAATKILVMGDHFRNEKVERYFYMGASGYIDQSATIPTFRYAIDTIMQQQQFLHSPELPFNGCLVINPNDDRRRDL